MPSGSEAGSYLRLIDFVYHTSGAIRMPAERGPTGSQRILIELMRVSGKVRVRVRARVRVRMRVRVSGRVKVRVRVRVRERERVRVRVRVRVRGE